MMNTVVKKRPHNLKLFDSDEDGKDILDTFAIWFGMDRELIVKHSRKQELVEVRDLIVYILREYAEMSYPAIGRLLGGRDHTTIIHAYKKVQKQRKTIADFESEFEALIYEATTIKKRKEAAENTLKAYTVDFQSSRVIKDRKRELTRREKDILELYREGITLREIGKSYELTHERIRQIVVRAFKQNVINQSVDAGIKINAEVLMQEEKNLRKKKRYPEKPKPEQKPKRWSRYHIACKKCGTTSIPHFRKGLCEKCGGKTLYGKERDDILSSHGDKCDKCDLKRKESYIKYGRDLYITGENHSVLCRGCFQSKHAQELGSYKHYEWSRFFPKCASCGTVSVPHRAKGLCVNCSSLRTQEERDRISQKLGDKCNRCGITKADSYKQTGQSLCLDKENELMCRSCFFKKRHEKN